MILHSKVSVPGIFLCMSLEPRRSRDTLINYYLSLEHMFYLCQLILGVI